MNEKYYEHESGYECWEVSLFLNSPAAQIFQYLFRRKQKENEYRDVQKALWWVKRWVANYDRIDNDYMTDSLKHLVYGLTDDDEDDHIKTVYCVIIDPSVHGLCVAEDELTKWLEENKPELVHGFASTESPFKEAIERAAKNVSESIKEGFGINNGGDSLDKKSCPNTPRTVYSDGLYLRGVK